MPSFCTFALVGAGVRCHHLYLMILQELDGAFILDKPAGVATHTPDGGPTFGFLEMAAKIMQTKLWAVHRLDKETSGCLLVTTTAPGVDRWTHHLAQGKKKYVFISHRDSPKAVWSFEGRISKTGNHRFALIDGEPNSFTTFAKLGPCGLGFMYEADISSGKTHQIRIHAEASGIPILGDNEHGGKEFYRLMLHARELELEGKKYFSPLPHLFELPEERAQLPYFADICKFLVSLDRRRFLINSGRGQSDCYRLVHREWCEDRPKLCIEKLGSVLQVLTYNSRELPHQLLKLMADYAQCEQWFVREMFDRGKTASDNVNNIKQASPRLPLQWTAQENKMNWDLRYGQGLSSGIFLDQRENREKVLHSTQGKRVANFFSYTCGFSVAAALGGAHEVVSVDTSSSSLEWGKNNFKINHLDPDQFEFFTADALFFLNACVKRKRIFDLIILDPPTFSRSKRATFRLKENLPELLDLSFKSLAPQGRLLITVNDESVTHEHLAQMIELSINRTIRQMIKVEKAYVPYDFEFPLERNTVMKGFWVSLNPLSESDFKSHQT